MAHLDSYGYGGSANFYIRSMKQEGSQRTYQCTKFWMGKENSKMKINQDGKRYRIEDIVQ